MTADEALAVLSNPLGHAHPEVDEALAVLRSGLQHARVLARAHEDRGMPASGRAVALRRFLDWDAGRRA